MGWSRILFHRKINVFVFDLMNHLFCIRYLNFICVACMFNTRYSSSLTVTCPEVDRSTTQVEWTSRDTYRIPIQNA